MIRKPQLGWQGLFLTGLCLKSQELDLESGQYRNAVASGQSRAIDTFRIPRPVRSTRRYRVTVLTRFLNASLLLRQGLLTVVLIAFVAYGPPGFQGQVKGSASSEQTTENKVPFGFSEKPTTCEINVVRLEAISRLAAQEIQRGGVLIAIARNGSEEKSAALLRRRLYNVRAFFTNYQPLKDAELITATGAAVTGHGRIEFYVGGKLADVLLIERNKDICVSCCDIDPRYYPDREPAGKSKRN